MSRWKKILIAAAMVVAVLMALMVAFVSFYDFNKFKPTIAKAVKNATGRELTLAGEIDLEFGIRPTLIAEDVSFQNAAWSSTPELARIKRMEVQVAILPMIIGKFDLVHLELIEPELIVEFDSSGTSNFAFDTPGDQKDKSGTSPPPLIFSDVVIEKGLFSFKDPRSDLKFSIDIERLTAKVPGFEKPMQFNFKGAFDAKALTVKGTIGPIWAWVEPGYSLLSDFTVEAGGAVVQVEGEMRDPINLKDMAFAVNAQGTSVAEVAKLAGQKDVPQLGAFKLAAKVADSDGKLSVFGLDLKIGSKDLVELTLVGDVSDVSTLKGIRLDFTAEGQDVAKLTQLGIPPPPKRGAFLVAAGISDADPKVFTTNNLRLVLGENQVNGHVKLNLAEEIPFLTAKLVSEKFEFGVLNLDFKMVGPVEKLEISKLDLILGAEDLIKIQLNGTVGDLNELEQVDLNFNMQGHDIANFEQLTGQTLPLRGNFSASGEVLIPLRKNLQIPDLRITAGKNNLTGSLNLDISGDKPQLDAQMEIQKLDLPSILVPELAEQGWVKGLGQVQPIKLDVKLAGFAREIALKKIDLRAGTLNSAELRLTGSVANLVDQKGIDLKFSLRGNEMAKLKEITAQPYFFAPVPGQGTYALTGHVSDPAAKVFKVEDFKFKLADTELTGRLNFNLVDLPPQYEVDLSAPKFNVKPFPISKNAAYANLNQIDDLGPLKMHSKVVVEDGRLSLPLLDIQAGSEQLVSITAKGSIKNLTEQTGIDLKIDIKGNEVAKLSKITGQAIPFKGSYGLTGRLTDPAQKNYKIGDLAFNLGQNNSTGSLNLNHSAKKLQLAADLASSKFTLQPVTLPALEAISHIKDLGPLKLALKLTGNGKKLSLDNLDFKLGREDLIKVALKGTIADLAVLKGMQLDFSATGSNMSNFEKLGGPQIPFEGAFNVSGQFSNPAPKVYEIRLLNAVWGDNNQRGWLALDVSAKRPRLKGELSSDKLDLRPLFADDEKQSIEKDESVESVLQKDIKPNAKNQASTSKVQKDKVFSAEPVPLAELQAIDIDLKIRDKQVLLPAVALDDMILDVLLKDGNLEIKPFQFSIGGGKADVQFALRSQEKPAALETILDIDQLEIGPMLDKLGYQRSVEGNMDATLNLNGSGDSIAAVMAGLNGNTRIAMSNGRAASEYLELLEEYLGSGILQMLNPFKEKREYTPINCFVNQIEIKDGLADIKILLDTDRTSILGAGDVNLKTEGLNLGIKPTPKKGAIPTGVSFSFKELSQPFRLGGTLAKPQLAVDPGRTAFVIGKMAGALALGPVGVAAFFADVSVGKKDACAIALGTATIEDLSSGEKKNEKKSGGFFKRLFRK